MNVSRKNPLHLSTWLIICWTAFALLLIVIPGEIDDRYYARDFQLQSHGLPWVHLHRFVPKPNSEGEGREQLQQRLESYRKHGNPLPLIPIPGGRYWTSFENWTFWKGILAPNWMGCLFNALACTAILLAVGFLVEHRRRKRNSFWQVSLPELLGIFVAVAVIVTLGGRVWGHSYLFVSHPPRQSHSHGDPLMDLSRLDRQLFGDCGDGLFAFEVPANDGSLQLSRKFST